MRFPKLLSAATVTTMLAAGAVFAPSATAANVTVHGDECIVTYVPQDQVDLDNFFSTLGNESESRLKAAMPESEADINLVISAFERQLKAGYVDTDRLYVSESTALIRLTIQASVLGIEAEELGAIIGAVAISDVFPSMLAEDISRVSGTYAMTKSQAQQAILETQEDLSENPLADSQYGEDFSPAAQNIIDPTLDEFDAFSEDISAAVQACADGESGTYSIAPGGLAGELEFVPEKLPGNEVGAGEKTAGGSSSLFGSSF